MAYNLAVDLLASECLGPVMWFFCAHRNNVWLNFSDGDHLANPPEVAKDPTKRNAVNVMNWKVLQIQDLIWLILQKQAVNQMGIIIAGSEPSNLWCPILRQTHKNYLCSNTPNCKPPIWDGKPLIWDGWNADAAHSMVKLGFCIGFTTLVFLIYCLYTFIIDSRMTFFQTLWDSQNHLKTILKEAMRFAVGKTKVTLLKAFDWQFGIV